MSTEDKTSSLLLEETTDKPVTKQVSEKAKEAKSFVHSINGYQYGIGKSQNRFELVDNHAGKKQKKPKCVKPFIISMWPVAFQAAFNKCFSAAFPQYAGNDKGSVVLNGSVSYDNVFYKHIEKLTSTDRLPDILITNDFNSLYHRGFRNTLLNNDNFESLHSPLHSIYSNTGITDPSNLFGMLASDALVMVVARSKFENLQRPREWYELLNSSLRNSIVLCGDMDFFCNTVYYPFIKNYGFEAIRQLKDNTLMRVHPVDMLQSANTGNSIGASVYVMPYSYAKKITDKCEYQIIWPEDGAILIPIQMLVKKGSYEKHEEVINLLTGKTLGNELEKFGFVATNQNTCKQYQENKLNWIGWDFIENRDLCLTKRDIRKLLRE
jgi:ABC-type Fe3+ transport system substrate-binding protein